MHHRSVFSYLFVSVIDIYCLEFLVVGINYVVTVFRCERTLCTDVTCALCRSALQRHHSCCFFGLWCSVSVITCLVFVFRLSITSCWSFYFQLHCPFRRSVWPYPETCLLAADTEGPVPVLRAYLATNCGRSRFRRLAVLLSACV